MERLPANPFLRPSAAVRWTRCPGSVALLQQMEQRGLPTNTAGPAAAAGTQAHLYAECRIKSLLYPRSERAKWADQAAEERKKLPPDMVKNAEAYVTWVVSYLFGRTEVE